MRTAFPKSTGQIPISRDGELLTEAQIFSTVEDVLATTQVIDIHTHLFAPAFGKLGLWGIDELLTYHYLEAEFFRSSDTRPGSTGRFPSATKPMPYGGLSSSK